VEGRAIGQRIGAGAVRVLTSVEQMHEFSPGEVLVADMTDPDWEPIMKRASAIVTNRGGRTCHAAIIARELGIPAVVGTGSATRELTDGREVTVSCAEGDAGYVYDGLLDFTIATTELGTLPELPVKIMMNVGTPDQAFAFSRLPHHGIGLARLEFIINRQIGIHPKALLAADSEPETLPETLRDQIGEAVAAYPSARDYFVTRVAEGVATLAAAFAPEPVIVRMSDFKSNEYANLLGGELYEPHEENPMIGYRGAARYLAARYLSADFADCFAMEAEALRYVRDEMGLTNVKIMIPFVRTLTEAERVVALLATYGLRRGENGLQVVMMCELPSNAVLAEEFLDYFDGFSIGSNDMTQLTLGLDRDSALVAAGFDERDPAVLHMLGLAVAACRRRGKYVGICGQGPSDHPDLAEWLLEQGIESMSLNPDTVVDTWTRLGMLVATDG
jgi:pyruvate, water dikinase